MGWAVALPTIVIGLQACDDHPTTEFCLLTGDPACGEAGTPNPGSSDGASLSDTATSDAGGPTGPDGSAYNCATAPGNGDPCTTPDGRPGRWGCADDGRSLTCHPTGTNDGGGPPPPPYNCADDPALHSPCRVGECNGIRVCVQPNASPVCQISPGGCPAPGSDAGGSVDGGSTYNCAADPNNGTRCSLGRGQCTRTGRLICTPRGDDLQCSAVPGPPTTEVCGNGLDDDCDGAVDEAPCIGGPPPPCPPTSLDLTVLSEISLFSLAPGETTSRRDNPLMIRVPSGPTPISFRSDGRMTITVSTVVGSQATVWEAQTGGSGDVEALLDVFFCRQAGILPTNPTGCNPVSIGDRGGAPYLAALRIDWQCWLMGGAFCPPTLSGVPIPRDLFVQKGIARVGAPVSLPPGRHYGVISPPPVCR